MKIEPSPVCSTFCKSILKERVEEAQGNRSEAGSKKTETGLGGERVGGGSSSSRGESAV